MVCAPVRSIIPSLKLGDYLSVQAHKTMLYLSLVYTLFLVNLYILLTTFCLISFIYFSVGPQASAQVGKSVFLVLA